MHPKRLSRLLNSLLGLLALGALMGCAAQRARAQITYTIPQTVTQTLAPSGTACTGSPQTFPVNNLGQTQHSLIAVAASTNEFQMYLQGEDQNGNFIIFSETAQSAGYSAPIIVIGSGYFPVIQAVVDCNGSGASFALTYSGTSSQPVPDSGNYLSTQIDKIVLFNVSANSNPPTSPIFTPFGNSAGVVSFYFASGSGSTGAALQVVCQSAQGGIVGSTYKFALADNQNNQYFDVPAGVCPEASVTYISGSGSTGSVGQVEYTFLKPGFARSPTGQILSQPFDNAASIAEKGARWSAVSDPAAGTQATVTRAGITAPQNAYHVVDCVSYSAGAITAPAATTLTVQILNNATPLWAKTISIPATAGMHVDGNVCGLNLIGGAGLSMTAQFSVALANESESITMTGYDVQ